MWPAGPPLASGGVVDRGDHDELHAAARARLEGRGLRCTARRERLLAVLVAEARPMTIAQICARAPDLALSSTYRNLMVLEAAGVVHRIVTGDEFARFELAEDLTGHHHHLVCTACGTVEDLPAAPALEAALAEAGRRARQRVGFRAERHRLDLLGRCRACTTDGSPAAGR